MSNETHSENPNTQSTVGQEFASNISVADLAILSTAYTPPDTLPDTPIKTKRRVTFNLQDIQVQTIPAYDSASSSSSEISLDIIKPERISKKESYDALLQRKQFRRDHPNTSTITAATTTTATTTTAKPGYWYPLASGPILTHTPISSLERTESLINETIQRELYSHYPPPSPSISPDTNSALDEPTATVAFDQIPISANKNALIISPPSSLHEDPIWVDHPTLLLTPLPQEPRTSLFFIKILKAESLDFPIDSNDTESFCSIQYKKRSTTSPRQPLSHTMQFDHEMKIENVDPNELVAITIGVIKKEKSWFHRFRPSSDLERYMHEKDGSICQTIFSPGRFVVDDALDQKATLMLVNNWYGEGKSTFRQQRKKSIMREKAVGKIYIQCVYITAPISCSLPHTMDEALEGLNAKRFHETEWQSGYLFQIDARGRRRQYFTLIGGDLLAHMSPQDPVLYKIPLSKATKLTFDACLFQLDFDGESPIQFSCESLQEFNKWMAVLQVMVCKLPRLPAWIST
ncbi:uncharacterized protein EV154DRAFT_492503 [Mucor mucedo]|uniref:uncharacterized protein n=1 Tax=Mucor mucedo TaxID=29922 RepID=UPI00221E80D6|nr:uncharacterized protein EV154DRAFT_492503 [Mucor mucedo]KAI7896508.1 hypothetical protein EV154DRAFT_492503 [Mucor mucedo]